MRVQFIGVGEAFDERYPNTSILVAFGRPADERHVLLDCGFTAAAAYYAHSRVGADLDAVWISHFHGDHFLGLPLLMLRFQEEGRIRPLVIVGQPGIDAKVWAGFELAYSGFRPQLSYPVSCIEAAPGRALELFGARCAFAPNEHSQTSPCLAMRLDHAGASVFYSGDGRPTADSARLAQGVDLLIHEAYGLEPDTPGHGGVPGCLELARNAAARRLALVHVNRRVRRGRAPIIRSMLAEALGDHGLLPEPGDVVAV